MERWEWEIVRRSTAMLSQGQQAAINRETALELLEDLGRLQERDKQAQELGESFSPISRPRPETLDARSVASRTRCSPYAAPPLRETQRVNRLLDTLAAARLS
jgi:hypothetical protein